jgi:flagellar motor protein MotB
VKTDSEKKKLRWFMGGLVFVAFTINGVFFRPINPRPAYVPSQYVPPQQQTYTQPTVTLNSGAQDSTAERLKQQTALEQAAADKIAAENAARQAADEKARADAAAKHAAELARYLDVRLSKTPGVNSVAVAVATEDNKLDRNIGQALARRFRSNNMEMLPSLFAPEFVSDGLFAKTFDGSRDPLARLDLADYLDGIVLARETVQYTQDASLDNLISAHLHLDVMSMPVSTRGDSQTWTFTANGAGFKRDDARSMAEERLIKQIAGDTNMSLTLNPANAR